MGKKASVHMSPMKGFDAAQGGENERRDWDKERYDRKEDSHGNINHYDWYRRKLNFEIVKGKICPQQSHSIPLHKRIQNRLDELGFKGYKNGARNAPNVIMDFVIGGNQERMREMAFGDQVVNFDSSDEKNSAIVRQKEIENWAMDTYRWLKERYGEENIIGFNVHLDETTPHIHSQVIPVAEMKKRGRAKAGQERGTKMTVSFAGVVGKTPEEYSAYKTQMHTDYFLQVGHKYGLERGTFFDDLTPEEQQQRKLGHLSKAEYVANQRLKEENQRLKEENQNLKELQNLIQKKIKSFTKMISNLEDKKEHLEIEITALKEMRDAGNKETEKQLQEKQRQLNEVDEKISFRTEQLNDVIEERRKLDELNSKTQQEIRMLAADATQRYDKAKVRLKEADRAIEEKRREITQMDKTGEIEKARRHVEERDAVLYRRWPEARDAVKSIFDFASSPSAHDFTPQQALHIEHAIVTSGTDRNKAAEELMTLARKDFDDKKTYSGWINGAAREVMKIANNAHQRLNALLKVQPRDAGGGPSYITDLTDWAGNQIKW